VALFQLEGSSNEETEFERVRFREKGCGSAFFIWNSNSQMVSLRRLKFGGTPLHWPKPSDKCDISLKKNPGADALRYLFLKARLIPLHINSMCTLHNAVYQLGWHS
jgi:hypothetical protein